ncbi:MAG: tRNA pseudouridine(38-40) synthase TruA [Gammaproteobacteria bacterium]|nr:MAG: tRNA pseudouridine(38-40) synthase TruA [Gammaproteobacteria bacterium]
MRIALKIEYDGSAFAGWQRQPEERTVQQEVETALTRVADHPVEVTCAGRTDAGVHAIGQVVHFDTSAQRTDHAWLLGVNSHLPDDVALSAVHPVGDDFHARFSAVRRCYLYRIVNRPTRPALERGMAWWVYKPLDETRMATAAAALVGKHDFSSFRAAGCQAKHPVRTLYRLEVARVGDELRLLVEANAFLQHMVRNLAGVLVAIGSHARAPEWAAEVLAARDRTVAGVTASPQGLCFLGVTYPARYGLEAWSSRVSADDGL